MVRGRRALRAVAAALLLTGPARAEPVAVRDAFGREVTLPAPPQRIVTIFASNTEIVAALGLTDRIIGIEAMTRFPAAVVGKPLVGGRLGFSVDAVVAQRPDLVVVTPARQAAYQLVDPMERIGVPIMVLLHRTVAEVIANIRLVGRAAGVPERGEAVAAGLEARLDRVQQQPRAGEPPRAVMITGRLGNGMLLVARPGTYTGDAIALAGARSALGESMTLAQISPEAVLGADPDVLLFAGAGTELASLIVRPVWKDMRAVRSGRAYAVSRAEFLIPGPRTVDGIERLAPRLRRTVSRP